MIESSSLIFPWCLLLTNICTHIYIYIVYTCVRPLNMNMYKYSTYIYTVYVYIYIPHYHIYIFPTYCTTSSLTASIQAYTVRIFNMFQRIVKVSRISSLSFHHLPSCVKRQETPTVATSLWGVSEASFPADRPTARGSDGSDGNTSRYVPLRVRWRSVTKKTWNQLAKWGLIGKYS